MLPEIRFSQRSMVTTSSDAVCYSPSQMPPSPSNHIDTVHCTDPNCRLPAGRIVNGALIYTTHHKHECVISLAWLRDILEKNSLTNGVQPVVEFPATATRRL